MRFWITKNSEVPVREQLVRQVLLGILSEDFPPGRKLPSVRPLARWHGIHSNTVSAGLLQPARELGHEPEEVLTQLEHMVRPSTFGQIVIMEPDQPCAKF